MAIDRSGLDATTDPSSIPRLSYVLIAEADVLRAARCVEAVRHRRLGAVVARDGAEATRVLESVGVPALLIVDLSLPGLDGVKVVEAVRLLDGTIPVLALAPCEEIRAAFVDRRPDLRVGRAVLSSASVEIVRIAVDDLLADRGGTEPRAAAPSSTMGALLEEVRRMTGAAGASVYLRSPEGDEMEAHVVWKGQVDARSPYCEPRILDWIRESGEPIVMPDMGGEPVVPQTDDRAYAPIRGLIAVPIEDDARGVVGVLCAFDVKPLAIDVDDLNVLKLLGHEAGRVANPGKSSR